MSNPIEMHGTTILAVRRGDTVCVGGDGQVSLGQTVVHAEPSHHAAEEKEHIVGPVAAFDELHSDDQMEDKGVGGQLQQRRDDRPEEANGGAQIAMSEVIHQLV